MSIKKIKFFAIFALLMATVFAFNSCSSAISAASSFKEVFNAEYKHTKNAIGSVAEIKELNGYQLLEFKGEFMVFTKDTAESGKSLAVFSARNKRVVLALDDASNGAAEIKLISGVPAFIVSRTTILCADDGLGEVTCELYDATGTLVTTVKGASPEPISFADTVLFNYVSYSVDAESGKLSKIADVSENLYLEKCSDWNDKYFYTYDNTINVYSRAFEHVYSWTLPSWAEYVSQNMLSNGCVLVQYKRPLDVNVDDYDIYEMDEHTGETKKFDVYSVLLNPENRTEKEIKLDYLVAQITTGVELVRASENNGMYRNDVENIAYIYPIEDGQVDYSAANADIVLMDNNAKLKRSLKIIDDQSAALPTCIGDNVYIVSTTYGMAIIDIDGNVLHQINNTEAIEPIGENIVSDNKIYTLNMEEVYSLYAEGADIIAYIDGTIFIKKGESTNHSIIAINGANKREICKYDAFDIEAITFEELSDVGCYSLCNIARGKYTYYNSNHELLFTSEARLEIVASDYASGVGVYYTAVENEVKYYVFY